MHKHKLSFRLHGFAQWVFGTLFGTCIGTFVTVSLVFGQEGNVHTQDGVDASFALKNLGQNVVVFSFFIVAVTSFLKKRITESYPKSPSWLFIIIPTLLGFVGSYFLDSLGFLTDMNFADLTGKARAPLFAIVAIFLAVGGYDFIKDFGSILSRNVLGKNKDQANIIEERDEQ